MSIVMEAAYWGGCCCGCSYCGPLLNVSVVPQVSGANQLLADEYLKDAKTPEEIRDGFTHMLGDVFMVLPVIKVAGYHRGQ